MLVYQRVNNQTPYFFHPKTCSQITDLMWAPIAGFLLQYLGGCGVKRLAARSHRCLFPIRITIWL